MKIFKIVLLLMIAPLMALAESTPAPFFSPELAAKSFASHLNQFKTVGEAWQMWALELSPAEMKTVEGILAKAKVDMNAKLPVMAAAGSKVTWGKNEIVFNPDRTFFMNGVKYTAFKRGALDLYLNEMMGKPTSSHFSIFLPTAEAFLQSGLPGLGKFVALVAAGAVGTGVGIVYLTKGANERLRDENVSCDGKYFIIRNMTRNAVGMATHKDHVLETENVSQILGSRVDVCDETTAMLVTAKIKRLPDSEKERLLPQPATR